MSERESGGRKRPSSKRGDQNGAAGQNGHDKAGRHEQELVEYLQERIKPGLNRGSIPLLARSIAKEEAQSYERELAEYLQERIKPGLNRGSIPLLARSIAKAIVHSETFEVPPADTEDSDDEPIAEEDFEAEMHELQAELGDQWILRFSVHGDDAWLTAETEDGGQRVEAQTAGVLLKAVGLLEEGGRGG
jgi:hypothetical protein